MSVLVDATVWSLAMRRRRGHLSAPERAFVRELESLIAGGDAAMTGPVRQETLTGVRDPAAFERLRGHLSHFDDVPLQVADFETAADFANRCIAAGIAVASTDLLLCAVAVRRDAAILTTDPDFETYAKVLPIRLHVPRAGS